MAMFTDGGGVLRASRGKRGAVLTYQAYWYRIAIYVNWYVGMDR